MILLLDSCTAGNRHRWTKGANGFDAAGDSFKGARNAANGVMNRCRAIDRNDDIVHALDKNLGALL